MCSENKIKMSFCASVHQCTTIYKQHVGTTLVTDCDYNEGNENLSGSINLYFL